MLSEDKLKAVMGAVLEVPPGSLSADSSNDTVEGWDSLRHMNLILALEEEFNVTIPDEEAGNLTSYALIKLVLTELLEDATTGS
jgi:acyl carrier protein